MRLASGSNAVDWHAFFPRNVKSLHLKVFGNDLKIYEYVVCRNCHSLYDFADCIVRTGRHEQSKLCHFVKFPNHPNISQRKECATELLK